VARADGTYAIVNRKSALCMAPQPPTNGADQFGTIRQYTCDTTKANQGWVFSK
jgi:hypothetical protein